MDRTLEAYLQGHLRMENPIMEVLREGRTAVRPLFTNPWPKLNSPGILPVERRIQRRRQKAMRTDRTDPTGEPEQGKLWHSGAAPDCVPTKANNRKASRDRAPQAPSLGQTKTLRQPPQQLRRKAGAPAHTIVKTVMEQTP